MLELFIDLGASDDQLECPFVYASAKAGVAVLDLSDEKQDMKPLFETILDYILLRKVIRKLRPDADQHD